MSEARQELEKRARNAILQEAFFRWESAINLGGALVLAVIFPAFWWLFLILGGLVEAGIGYSTLRNPALNAKAVATIFERKFEPQALNSADLKQKTFKALEYLQLIEETVGQTKEGLIRDRLKRTAEEVIDWVEQIYHLASRVDKFQQNEITKRDLKSVPETIKGLRRRLVEEDDAIVRRDIEDTISDRERQLATLERLENTMERADLQLDRTLAALGTVYSELQLIGTKRESASRAERLQEQISEQVHQLQDISEAMDEVYLED